MNFFHYKNIISGNINMKDNKNTNLMINFSSIKINNELNIFTKIKNVVNNENDNDNIENFIDKKINYIYVIELDEGKYYIGKTKTLIHRLIKHKKGKGSSITTKYKWKRLVDVIRCDDKIRPIDLENKITLEYMRKYKYNNVFGGKFYNIYRKNEEPYELKNFKEENNNNLYNRLLKKDINLINENLDNIISKHNKKTTRGEEVIYTYYFKYT